MYFSRSHLNVSSLVIAFLLILQLSVSAVENHVMVSWGDQIIVCGPGTDAAMDSQQAITTMMKRIKGRGYTGIAWRADLADYEPGALYINDSGYVGGLLVDASLSISESFDVLPFAQAAAEAEGLEFWLWVTSVYSDGSPQDFPTMAYGRPFTYERKYVREHPEVLTIDRDGNTYYGIREYAYPGARADKVDEIVYFAEHWGIKKIIACMRSEASQFQLPPDRADRYGFNQPVVDEMLSRYGINILTAPEFDVDDPAYSPTNPNVELWHDLRGEYLTQFYTELRAAMDAVDPAIELGVMIPGGDYTGPVIGNVTVDWRKWIDDGLLQNFILPSTLAATEQWDYPYDDYLTDNITGRGVYPVSTFRAYADSSPHPETTLLHTGGNRNHRTVAPAGADGWRTWIDQDTSDLGWYQRWRQWKKDLVEWGHIKFFEQNFDDFPEYSSGRNTGWGEYRYVPSLRACPGLWWPLGDGTDNYATAQSEIKHGSTGRAIKLKKTGDSDFNSRHLTITQRAYWSVDNAIMNGEFTFDFWLYRPDISSALTVYLTQELNKNTGFGLWFMNSGLRYREYQDGAYYWFYSGVPWPINDWQKFSIHVDVDSKTYSAYAGENNETLICSDVPYSEEISYFNMLVFSPQGSTGTLCYLDDVSVKWIPELYYTPKGKNTYIADDFESHVIDQTVCHTTPDVGQVWQVYPYTQAPFFYTENDLSYGNGWKCLAVPQLGNGTVISSNDGAKLVLAPNNLVTLDLDVFVETGKTAAFGLAKSSTGSQTALVSIDSAGKIMCWNGSSYADSGQTVTNGMWYHFQLALDCASRTYKVVAQQTGTMPFEAGVFNWGSDTSVGDGVVFRIETPGVLLGSFPYVYYDNIEVHYGLPNECGDEYNPYPPSDLTQDCIVDQNDLDLFVQNWLTDGSISDLNNDGEANLQDFALFAKEWLVY